MKVRDAAIVVVNYNGTVDTLRCLDSLRPMAAEALVIVVDNGSQPDEHGRIAAAHPWSTVLRRETNGGWAGGNNAGIRHALNQGAEWVVLLNNDTTVSPGLLGRLRAAADAAPTFGVLGPVINAMETPDTIMTDGVAFNRPGLPGSFFTRIPVDLKTRSVPAVTEVEIVNGCCMMVSAEVFRRIGLVDERFFLVHEEADFCLRARAAGFRSGVISEALVWHKGSASFKRTGRRLQRYYDTRNLLLLIAKHASSHARGRGRLRSRLEWLRYAAYRYSVECEAGERDAADAILEGVWDAIVGQHGAFAQRRRPGVPALRLLLDSARRARAFAHDSLAAPVR